MERGCLALPQKEQFPFLVPNVGASSVESAEDVSWVAVSSDEIAVLNG